jgi:hypothetical protein
MLVAARWVMTSASSFLLASRQCEIAELEQLAHTSELVAVAGRFIHALQRERGISNVFLGSGGLRFASQRVGQVAASEAAEREMRAQFGLLDTDPRRVGAGSRLFNAVALVLHAMEGLPRLRTRIAARAIAAPDATAAYGRLVAGLLGVVFDAADSATDPQVSRALVAMFNFMQGKEFTGQERAFGSRVFAAGYVDAAGQQHWRHLVESQDACLQVFRDFAEPQVLQFERSCHEPRVAADIERLRHLGGSLRGELDPNLSHPWYEACTRRMDAMKEVEDFLASHLRALCEARIAQARDELRDQRATLDALLQRMEPVGSGTAPALGPQLERSVLEMAQAQARRLQEMGDELQAVRASLQERKLVERAKGLLMAHRQMSEDDAYKALRQMAMNQNRRLVEVASALLSLADVLPGGAH